jgi:branched-chain amino acid transport system permease protein
MVENFLLEVLFFGTLEASVYMLLAMGFSLVYGVGGILNLSHGAFYLLAGYILFWGYVSLGVSVMMIITVIIITTVGGVSYILMIEPLQKTELGVVLATFALGFFFEQFIKVAGDALPHTVPVLIPGSIKFGGLTITAQSMLTIFGSIVVVIITMIFINKSKIGKSIRAVSQDREAAMLMGINADRILMYTMMISAFLAGIAAVLYVPASSIAPHLGWDVLTNSFAIVILGGLGSIPGSILGAFILGYTRNFANYYISPSFSALIPIVVIVLVLVLRPRGILGKKELRGK